MNNSAFKTGRIILNIYWISSCLIPFLLAGIVMLELAMGWPDMILDAAIYYLPIHFLSLLLMLAYYFYWRKQYYKLQPDLAPVITRQYKIVRNGMIAVSVFYSILYFFFTVLLFVAGNSFPDDY